MAKQESSGFSIKLRYAEDSFNLDKFNAQRISKMCLHKPSLEYTFCGGENFVTSRRNPSRRRSLRLPPIMDNIYNTRVVLRLQWELFYCVWLEIWKSKQFRKSFICWLFDTIESYSLSGFCRHNSHNRETEIKGDLVPVCSNGMDKLMHLSLNENDEKRQSKREVTIDMRILFPPNVLSIKKELFWACLLLPLIHQKLSLEYISACLSTLGGAYSSLGEHSISHAKVAGDISKRQLAIALKMNNLVLMSHCRLYYAHSLMQTGKFKLASNIIRQEYTIASSNRGMSDPKLISCCKAAWIKLKYLQKRRRDEHIC